jgi:hypothetical protein
MLGAFSEKTLKTLKPQIKIRPCVKSGIRGKKTY